jgi:hypothetical protein
VWLPKQSTQQTPQSAKPADLFLGHHPLELFGLALDTVTGTSVRLNGQAADDRIDAALLNHGAALRSLDLVVDVIIYRVNMGHRSLSTKQGTFSRWAAAKQQISQIATEKVKTGKLSFFNLLDRFTSFSA